MTGPATGSPVKLVDDWTCNWFGWAFLHARFEWVGGVNDTIDSDGFSDAGPTVATMLETVTWHGRQIRVPQSVCSLTSAGGAD